MRNNNQDPTAYSQERRQDDTLSSGTRKLVRSGESASSARARKLERGEDSLFERTRLKFQISDHRYLEKVFKNLRQKLNLAEEAPVLDLKANVVIWELLMSTTMKASVHQGPNHNEHLEVYRNTNFEVLQNLFDIMQRLILEHEAEILNVSPIDWRTSSLTRSTLSHDQSDHVDESNSTCLLRFPLMLREDARAFRSEAKMECSTRRISTVQSNSYRENRLSLSGVFFFTGLTSCSHS